MIEVLTRYLSRIDRLGDDPRVVLIRHHYVFALLWNTRYREAAVMQRENLQMADRLGDSGSKAYALAGEIIVIDDICAKVCCTNLRYSRDKAIQAAAETATPTFKTGPDWVIGWEECNRGRMNKARDSARELLEFGRLLNDPRSTGFGLNLLSFDCAFVRFVR